MFRRVISIVLVCASLLGLAHPLMACAAAMQTSDCCTGDPASGCTTDSAPMLTGAGTLCCAAVPASSASSLALPTRSDDQAVLPAGSHAPVLINAFDDNFKRGFTPSALASAHASSNRADASLTYLFTARLRL